MNKLGLIRVAAATPKLAVANTTYNTQQILRCAQEAGEKGAAVILFPELCITGYTCGDLFYQNFLYEKNLEGLNILAESTKGTATVLIVGFYLRIESCYYNCAALLQNGCVMGVVPKMFLPDSKEFNESRWFSSGAALCDNVNSVRLFGNDVPFGRLLFQDGENQLTLGIEICQDLWAPITPGSHLALNGAHILFNSSASNDIVGKSEYRRRLVLQSSASNICGYVYTSAGVHESTTDLVFGGDSLIAENGSLLAQGDLFQRDNSILYGEIDCDHIRQGRAGDKAFTACGIDCDYRPFAVVPLQPLSFLDGDRDCLLRTYSKTPFISQDPQAFRQNCQDVFQIQTAGLAKRLSHSGAKTAIVGISGGLDSTLALLVTVQTFKLLGKDPKNLIAVTMPGFGTTDQTYQNALTIMRLLGTEVREIPIKDAVLQHFKDIGQDLDNHDVTYENAQARERTQILMDLANQTGGLVVGTGDLSEAALGWCTYNGDHMSMYGVNSGIPKTLVGSIIRWVMENRLCGPQEDVCFSSDNPLLKKTLQDILDTPISPELLPPDSNGQILQKTEDTVGPYVLHDFFLYYTLRFGTRPKKLLFLAKTAFAVEYDEACIKKWLKVFYRRFFTQQFKRSCSPDGPKVGSVSLSPRGDWRMPSDADPQLWLSELE